MAILKVVTFPDPVLKQKTKPVTEFDAELRRLVEDMIETMYDAPGVGLAANQVGISKNVLVLDAEYSIEAPEGVADRELRFYKNKNPKVFINTQIIEKSGSADSREGCLSVPGVNEEIKRHTKIRVKFQDLDGGHHEMEVDGFTAIILQHEVDHLEGRLFIDRLSPIKRSMIKSRIKKSRSEKFERSKFHVDL